jgi:hypothetical protein
MRWDEQVRENLMVLWDGALSGDSEIELLTEEGGRLWFTSIHNPCKKIRPDSVLGNVAVAVSLLR